MTRPPIEYYAERLEAFGEPGKTTIAALLAYVKELEAKLRNKNACSIFELRCPAKSPEGARCWLGENHEDPTHYSAFEKWRDE